MPAKNVGAEIKQLTSKGPSKGPQKGQVMPRKQAIAVALSMQRRGDIKKK